MLVIGPYLVWVAVSETLFWVGVGYFGWVGHYFGWVVVSGGVWSIILEEWMMTKTLVWVGRGGWGWMAMSGGEWRWVHCLIIPKINYKQPHWLRYYCQLSENNEKKLIYYGANGKPWYTLPKKFFQQSYQNSIDKHDFMLHKKSDYCNYCKKDT